jgi:hypothetical protein
MGKIRIKKSVLSKDDFDKSIDRSFKTFIEEQVEDETDSIQELFRLYDKFYYEIPVEGDELSHEFLVKESSKLIKVEADNDAIQPLLDEISELRQRILEQQEAAIEEIEDLTELDGTS